jgi:catechol 2,3-dioxygenase-like lactoylglutathione lyase family enzyme
MSVPAIILDEGGDESGSAGVEEAMTVAGQDERMEVLSSRILLRPSDPARSHRFYRDTLGLAIYREFGSPDAPGLVFFLGNGLLEVSGRTTDPRGDGIALWMQIRDVHAEHRRLLDAGVSILREPRREAWGLLELWIEDPDKIPIVMVEIPDDHPLRRDQRSIPAHEK